MSTKCEESLKNANMLMDTANQKLNKIEESEKFRKWTLLQIDEKGYAIKSELIKLITDLYGRINNLREQFIVPGLIGEEGKYDCF